MRKPTLEETLEKIRNSKAEKLKKEKSGGSGNSDPRILKFKKNCKYYVRLLRSTDSDGNDQTFVNYKDIGFETLTTPSEYIYLGRSLSDADPTQAKNDYINKLQWKLFSEAKKSGDEDAMKRSYKLIPQRHELVNAFLHKVEGDDPDAQQKIGTVVVLKYSAGIDKKTGEIKSDLAKLIDEEVLGGDDVGIKAFDLSPKGRSLIVRVTTKADWNNYSTSKFADSKAVDNLSPSDYERIENSVHNLLELVPAVKSEDELKSLIDQYWFGEDGPIANESVNSSTNSRSQTQNRVVDNDDGDDDGLNDFILDDDDDDDVNI